MCAGCRAAKEAGRKCKVCKAPADPMGRGRCAACLEEYKQEKGKQRDITKDLPASSKKIRCQFVMPGVAPPLRCSLERLQGGEVTLKQSNKMAAARRLCGAGYGRYCLEHAEVR
jgi:hypothetical protein